MKYYLKIVLALLSIATYSSGAVVKRMYSEKTSAVSNSDLEASASGYIYNSASGHPTSYVHFTRDTGAPSHPVQVVPVYYYTKPQQFEAAPVPFIAQPTVKEELANEELEQEQEPFVEDKEELNDDGENEELKTDDDGEGGQSGGESGFEEQGGQEYGNAQHSAHGEKGAKGYENKHSFGKGLKGAHGQKQDEGYYKENGGKKAGHYDSAGHYNEHHEEGKGSKGEKHGEKKYHKKGQNTKGFHNVYHKDEYKKDHTFYDEADKNGFFKKHGNQAAHHASDNGGHKKGGSSDAAYHADNYGKKGQHDKGFYDKEDEGFQGKKGQESHYATYADYAKENGKHGGAEFGYNQGGHKY